MIHQKIGAGGYGTFGEHCNQYAAGRKGFPGEIPKFIFRLLCNDPFLLDLGCGTGISTRQMASWARCVIGCDPDIRMIETALQAQCERTAFVLGSAEGIPWSASAFDAVTSFSSFHWFDNQRALDEIWRVLKNRGVIAIINKEDSGDVKQAYRALVQRYVEDALPNAKKTYQPLDKLIQYGFVDIQKYSLEIIERYTRDEAMNYFQSLSLWNLIPNHLKSTAERELEMFCHHRAQRIGIFERPIIVTVVTGRKVLH